MMWNDQVVLCVYRVKSEAASLLLLLHLSSLLRSLHTEEEQRLKRY
jgi:hypothetical protein